MDRINEKSKKVVLWVTIGILILTIFTLWVWTLGFIIGLSSLLLLLMLLIIVSTKFFIFPGSFSIWRKWWQSSLELELARNFLDHLSEIKFILEILKNSHVNMSHIKSNHQQLTESKDVLKIILYGYRSIETSLLNSDQKVFLDRLNLFFKSLSETVLIFPSRQETLWNVLDDTSTYDWSSITFDDFPENNNLSNCLSSILDLESCIVSVSETGIMRKVIKEGLFSNLNLLRLVLQSSCKCEQYFIPGEVGEIDCILIKNSKTPVDSSVLIFCNPNGGLYEYSCYQNQWLEFYITNGIDLCLWNYRGYGRSLGSPSSNGLRADGQAVYNFLSKVKMYNSIGVHGESIGGMVASYIARYNNIQFLFADRTFSSLECLVSNKLYLPKTVFKCFSNWEDNTLDDFLGSECYKILSCDPNDEIVVDRSSLKYGISARQPSSDLASETFNNLFHSIKTVSTFMQRLKVKDSKDIRDSNVEATHNSMYLIISKDVEPIEDETVSDISLKIFKALEIDAGGVSLYDINTENELRLWIKTSQIWGSFLPIGSSIIGTDKFIKRLETSINLLKDVFKENEFVVNPAVVSLSRQARFLKNGLSELLKIIETKDKNHSEELSIREDNQNTAGYLIPLNCGHNGRYSEEEKSMVLEHLIQGKFII